MFRSVKALAEMTVEAADGPLGQVKGLLFNQETWLVEYLVVDASAWLPERQILLAPAVLARPASQNQGWLAAVRREQVEASPKIDIVDPLSRRQVAPLQAHYGWPESVRRTQQEQAALAPDAEDRAGSYLHSLREVTGYRIQARDGEIGHVEDFIFDDETWTIQYMVVDTGQWLPGKQILFAAGWTERIDWDEKKVQVDLSLETVESSPRYDSVAALNRDRAG